MLYSNRFKQILKICLEQDPDYVSIDALAKRLKTSRRTIFRELQNVDLKRYRLSLASKAGKGIRLEGKEEDKRALLDDLEAESIPYFHKEERQKYLAFELLRFPEVKKLVYYGNLFEVSETTVSKDLDAIEPLLARYDLKLDRTHKNKIQVLGSEENRRRAMSAIVHNTLENFQNDVDSLDPQALQKEIFASSNEGILKLLNQTILDEVLDLFTNEYKTLHLDQYAQSAYIGLIIHLVVAIERIQKGEEIVSDPALYASIAKTSAMEQAQKISQKLEEAFLIQIPQAETTFIAMHLLGSKSANPQNTNDNKQIDELAFFLIEQLPLPIRSSLKMDPQFMQGFITHLQPTLIRLQYALPIYNPLLEKIQEQYPSLYADTKKAAKKLEAKIDLPISEAEIGFMTMHIGASLERRRIEARRTKVQAGVVCASGVGVSALLVARLQSVFQNRIKFKTLSLEQYYQQDFEGLDLIITTFELQSTRLPVIKVNPLLSAQDIDTIREIIADLPIARSADQSVDHQQKIASIQQCSQQMLGILNNLVFAHIDPDTSVEDMIGEASVLALGNQSMIEEALKKREEIGSLFMDELHFGLLHATSEGVKSAQAQFIWPKEGKFTKYPKIEAVVVLLLPKAHAMYEQKLLSLITINMMESTELKQAVLAQEERRIVSVLSNLYLEMLQTESFA